MMLSSMDQGALGVELTGIFCSSANLSRSARPLCACQLGFEKARVSDDKCESVVELWQAPGSQNLQGGVTGLPCQLEANLTRRSKYFEASRIQINPSIHLAMPPPRPPEPTNSV